MKQEANRLPDVDGPPRGLLETCEIERLSAALHRVPPPGGGPAGRGRDRVIRFHPHELENGHEAQESRAPAGPTSGGQEVRARQGPAVPVRGWKDIEQVD